VPSAALHGGGGRRTPLGLRLPLDQPPGEALQAPRIVLDRGDDRASSAPCENKREVTRRGLTDRGRAGRDSPAARLATAMEQTLQAR